MVTETVSIVEPCVLFREGLKRLLESENLDVVGTYSTMDDFLAEGSEASDLLLVNEGVDPEGVRTAQENQRATFIVVVADTINLDNIRSYFSLGVDGYLLKTISSTALGSFLRLVLLGEKVFPSGLAAILCTSGLFGDYAAMRDDQKASVLSDRELQIISQLSNGASNKLIANELEIAEATVKVHLKSILRKLGLNNRTQAAIWGVRHGYQSTQSATD